MFEYYAIHLIQIYQIVDRPVHLSPNLSIYLCSTQVFISACCLPAACVLPSSLLVYIAYLITCVLPSSLLVHIASLITCLCSTQLSACAYCPPDHLSVFYPALYLCILPTWSHVFYPDLCLCILPTWSPVCVLPSSLLVHIAHLNTCLCFTQLSTCVYCLPDHLFVLYPALYQCMYLCSHVWVLPSSWPVNIAYLLACLCFTQLSTNACCLLARRSVFYPALYQCMLPACSPVCVLRSSLPVYVACLLACLCSTQLSTSVCCLPARLYVIYPAFYQCMLATFSPVCVISSSPTVHVAFLLTCVLSTQLPTSVCCLFARLPVFYPALYQTACHLSTSLFPSPTLSLFVHARLSHQIIGLSAHWLPIYPYHATVHSSIHLPIHSPIHTLAFKYIPTYICMYIYIYIYMRQ